MAVTKIRKIKKTPQKALEYAKRDKEAEIVKTENDELTLRDKSNGNVVKLNQDYLSKIKDYINYNEDGSITFKTISTGINCSVINAHNEWQAVRDMSRNGNNNVVQYDIYQNFGIEMNPELAHQIGIEFAEKYLGNKGFQCIVCTHLNTGKVHNHIQFNATNAVTLKKFHDCLQTINDIRKNSDELCYKYNLKVLDKTKKMNLARYTSDDGSIGYFEPTERKSNITKGEFAKKNDYRNTKAYSDFVEYKDNHKKMLKNDIDKIVPYVKSYPEFLQQMENAGYEIQAKTKNDEWRKHITFKFMTWEKGIRDYSLGTEYERESLTEKIERQLQYDIENEKNNTVENYENDDLEKAFIIFDNKYNKMNNSKKLNELHLYIINDTLHCKHQYHDAITNGINKSEVILKQVNANLKTLNFVEQKNIKSFEQIHNTVNVLYDKRHKIGEQMNNIEQMLNNMKMIIDSSNNINSSQMGSLKENYKSYFERYQQLQVATQIIDNRIQEYDNCVLTLDRIDKSRKEQAKYKEQIDMYYENKNKEERKEQKQAKNRNVGERE